LLEGWVDISVIERWRISRCERHHQAVVHFGAARCLESFANSSLFSLSVASLLISAHSSASVRSLSRYASRSFMTPPSGNSVPHSVSQGGSVVKKKIASAALPNRTWRPNSRRQLTQLHCIGRRGTLLIVVEINKYVVSLPLPGLDAPRPFRERVGTIMPLVVTPWAVAPDIDEVGSALPWRGGILVIRQAKRDIPLGQQFHNAGLVPAWGAEIQNYTGVFLRVVQRTRQGGRRRPRNSAAIETGSAQLCCPAAIIAPQGARGCSPSYATAASNG
jgi:hypothetical protein